MENQIITEIRHVTSGMLLWHLSDQVHLNYRKWYLQVTGEVEAWEEKMGTKLRGRCLAQISSPQTPAPFPSTMLVPTENGKGK